MSRLAYAVTLKLLASEFFAAGVTVQFRVGSKIFNIRVILRLVSHIQVQLSAQWPVSARPRHGHVVTVALRLTAIPTGPGVDWHCASLVVSDSCLGLGLSFAGSRGPVRLLKTKTDAFENLNSMARGSGICLAMLLLQLSDLN
jgi:hypothetical protein